MKQATLAKLCIFSKKADISRVEVMFARKKRTNELV